MDLFDTRYFRIPKTALLCFGLWGYQNYYIKCVLRIIAIASVTTCFYSQLNFIFHAWGHDLDAILDGLGPLSICFIAINQLGLYIFKEKKLFSLVDCIKNDWKLWTSKDELEILDKHAKGGRRLTIIKMRYSFTGVTLFVMGTYVPLLLDVSAPSNETHTLKPVYPGKFFFDEDKYFKFIMGYTSVTMTINILILFTCEILFCVITQHACGLFAIIGHRLKNIIRNMKDGNQIKSTYKELCYSIQYHNYAIRFADDIDTFYSPFLFFTIGSSILLISVTLIQALSSLDHNLAYTPKFSAVAMAVTYHVYFLGMPAENLLNESTKVATFIYDSDWYDIPVQYRKIIPLMLILSSRPCQLSIGPVAVLNMETVSKIIKMGLSYFTVLSSLRQT